MEGERAAADADVCAENDPSAPGHLHDPLVVRRILGKVIIMDVRDEPGTPQDAGELDTAEIAVAEELHPRHAAFLTRSNTMASSIACDVTP